MFHLPIHHDTMYKKHHVSHFLLSGGQSAINSMVIKRPASALTQVALDAHGENTDVVGGENEEGPGVAGHIYLV